MPKLAASFVALLLALAACGDPVTVETRGRPERHETAEIAASRLPATWADEGRRKFYAVNLWRSVALISYRVTLDYAAAYDQARTARSATRSVLGHRAATTARESTPTRPPVVGVDSHLARIAACESGGDPRAVSASGRYRGAWQWALSTWFAYGGGQYADDPIDATLDEQLIVARATYAGQGPGAWPVCQHR
jgi:hypothetical protein